MTDTYPLLEFRELTEIEIDKIVPNPHNPREKISKREVKDIRDSIKEMGGILVPLLVYEKNGKFVLLDGERRWRAAKELAKYDDKYKKIPANVILGPLSKNENILVMFNVHMERKQWSTSAIAEAIGEMIKLNPNQSNKEIANKLRVKDTVIREARQFLRMPINYRKRCLDGDLDEYYLILLARNLESSERTFPNLMRKYDWNDVVNKFMDKVDVGLITKSRDFNYISNMAKNCITHNEENLFVEVFDRMIEEKTFTPADANRYISNKLGYKIDSAFRKYCREFLNSLKSYYEDVIIGNIKITPETKKVLKKIADILTTILKRNQI